MRVIATLLFSASLAYCQTTAATHTPSGEEVPPARATALENLLAERESDAAFAKLADEARKQGVKEQAILEARFLYHVDRNEDDAIAAMLPDFLKQKEHFVIADSEIFSSEEDWLAVIEYVQAINALKKGDKSAFKQHITEAFWLSPRQGAAFASNIERMRLDDAMRAVKIDFNNRVLPLTSGAEPTVLSSLIKEKKALLLHFWSPWNNECIDSLPDFFATAKKLESSKISVLSLIPDAEVKMVDEARKTLQPLGQSLPGSWGIDSKEHLFTKSLRVQTMPTMVLISPDGNILYNGHPADDEFWSALSKLDPSITRPETTQTPPSPPTDK